MNADLILMLGAIVLLAISGLLVFCFTEARGKNTPHARKEARSSISKSTRENTETRSVVTH
jgi:hypothetical protein